ncbi:MAG: AI-2E family transporter [Verrucomicrobia bacterium]|nr:AI-2E family transporter [Verrucomicrobiota bacterium]
MPETETAPFLSNAQRRLLAFALGLFAVIAIVALLAFVLVVLGDLVGFFSGVLWPLAVACVLALILRPAVDLLEKRFNGRRTLAVVLLYAVFLLFVAGLLVTAIPPLVDQILDFIAFIPTLWAQAIAYVKVNYPSWVTTGERLTSYPAVTSMLDSLQAELSKAPSLVMPSLKAMSQGVASVFGFVAHLAIIPIYLFFFLLVRRDLTQSLPAHLPFLRPTVRDDIVFLVGEFVNIVVSFFRGQLLIGLIMGLLLAIGFSICGLKFGFFIGLTLGILNIIPYLGTIIGLAVTIPLAFFQPGGGLGLIGLVLMVYVIVQNIEGWFLTPKIMGERTGLHPVMIIVAIFFWGTAFKGLLGMILAIPLTAFFVTAWRFGKWRYFPANSTPTSHDTKVGA